MAEETEIELVVFEGRQYPVDQLPEGVKKSDTVPFADRQKAAGQPSHKAVQEPEPAKSRKS